MAFWVSKWNFDSEKFPRMLCMFYIANASLTSRYLLLLLLFVRVFRLKNNKQMEHGSRRQIKNMNHDCYHKFKINKRQRRRDAKCVSETKKGRGRERCTRRRKRDEKMPFSVWLVKMRHWICLSVPCSSLSLSLSLSVCRIQFHHSLAISNQPWSFSFSIFAHRGVD